MRRTLVLLIVGTAVLVTVTRVPVRAQADAKPLAFEVASVKANKSDAPGTAGFPLGPGDAYVPSGGRFSATNQPLIVYLRFAYKLSQGDLLDLAGWVYNDRFDIDARVSGMPTKDQMRLMMRTLLAERFKVKAHTEKQMGRIFGLVPMKVGKTGPRLLRHAPDGSCTTAAALQLQPIPCSSIGPIPAAVSGRARIAGNGVTMERVAGYLTNPFTGVERPVVDHTGFTGTFDLTVEWSMEPDADPTFLEALQEQLGLRLNPTTGPVEVLVIDHVEHPTDN